MAITLEHFCTKTGKPIIADGQPVTDTIDHCLAEYFAPNATFKIGVVYQGLTTEEDLKKHSGLSLQFAADDRFFFMDETLREKIFDQPHFGAAYGSNMFTPLKSFEERENLRVLVVDASTGENGGIMPNAEAIKLVGDGDGKIDTKLHESLGNTPQTPFQTRFGIKSRQQGLEPDENAPITKTWQLGKGTFAPRDLSLMENGYDLVISTDQLKGRKNVENDLGILGSDRKLITVGNEIQPGEYIMRMGIGNKTDAYYGVTSTGAQFWNSFPLGVQGDVLPRLEKRLEELKEMASDPRKIAQDYIDSMDARYKHQIKEEEKENFIDINNSNLEAILNVIEQALGDSDQDVFYRLLKADLNNHCQLLELPRVIDKLQEHWREQYLDCASGRLIKFDSAMAQTCYDLAENEVCYPKMPDGAEVIVYRGPTANSNTVDIYINKHLPDEPLDKGTIKMSPKGLKHSLSDCDGDRMAIALASEFPHTTAEIKAYQQEENRYADIIKLAKKAYQGSFEQIALDAMENKVGMIANLCMKGIALENECIFVPKEEARSLMRDLSIGAMTMLAAENDSKNPISYPDNIRQQIVELAKFSQKELNPKTDIHQSHNPINSCQEEPIQKTDINQANNLSYYKHSSDERKFSHISEEDVNIYLNKAHNFYHDVVGIMGSQLQIEVDRGKSANRSDPNIINACNVIVKNPDIALWVEERKVDEVYIARPMNIKGHGAIDLMAKMTNEAFEENALVARSTQQFQDLFKSIEFSSAQKQQAAQLKKTYDTLVNRAIEISREVAETPGPRIVATSAKGNSLEIIGLAESKHPNAFDTNRKLDIMIVENNDPKKQAKNQWIALAPVFDKNGLPQLKDNGKPMRKRLGYISQETVQKYPERMKQWAEFKGLTSEVLPGLTQRQVKTALNQAREFAEQARQSIPDSQKEAIVAAMWQLSTASSEKQGFRKTSAVFAMFGDEIIGRLSELQFTDFAVVGTHKPSNEHQGRKWVGEKVPCSIVQAPDPAEPMQNKRWLVAEGKKLGVFRSESAQLPISTKFEAEISSPQSASVILTSTIGNQLKVGQLKKYAYPEREWKGEKANITINLLGGKIPTAIALIDGKPLGVIDKESLALLSEKLSSKGRTVQGFQFTATLESAPATIANLKVDLQTIQYPEIWTRETSTVNNKSLSLTDALKPLLKEKYKEKIEGLLHDDESGLRAYLIPSNEVESFMHKRGINTEHLSQLSNEIDRKFGASSFVGIAEKGDQEELYFGILLPTQKSEEKTATRIEKAFNFPLEYEQMQGGERIKFIAAPLDETLELISKAQTQIQQGKEEQLSNAIAVPSEEKVQISMNPLANLQPLNERVTPHFQKDVAMAEVATQFIGTPATLDAPSSTRNYQEAWRERANTGVYTAEDTVMVSGSGLWRGVSQSQIEQTFQQHYVPLLDKAVEAKAAFVVGDARGCDQLVQQFLQECGYKFEHQDGFIKCTPESIQEIESPLIQATSFADAPSAIASNIAPRAITQPETTPTPTQSSQAESTAAPVREAWEIEMLKQAIDSLKANTGNADEEIQTATFSEGKYRIILHEPTETLRIVDEISHRGTLYKAQKGQPAKIGEFTSAEQESFLHSSVQQKQSRSSQQQDLEH